MLVIKETKKQYLWQSVVSFEIIAPQLQIVVIAKIYKLSAVWNRQ